ncbi:MAG: TonB-dependent receptor [Hyphomicrobiaceae bacterium]|nr:TonB-dependent receptor [Hyphomicrobiaceae bacterium]
MKTKTTRAGALIIGLCGTTLLPVSAFAQQPPGTAVPPAPTVTPPAVNAPAPPPAPAASSTQPPSSTTAPTPAAPATTAQPVPAGSSAAQELPPVVVQQQEVSKPKPKPVAARTAPKPKPQQQAAPAAEPAPAPVEPTGPISPELTTDQLRTQGEIVRISPIGGSEIAVGKVPGSVSTVSGAQITKPGSTEPQDVLQKQVPGIVLNDAAGSDMRAQIDYRGFGSGSLNGFPQGLAVYQNGVRINEVFGDTVNWDILPKHAIADMTVLSGNPIFGLNAIGGAISVVMKDGFQFQGVEIDTMFGSFGRKQAGIQIGQQSGPFALYFAGEAIQEDGWRDFSPAETRRAYLDLGFKRSGVEAHFNLTMADSEVGAIAATPVELLAIERSRTYTSPQTTDLEVFMPSFNASVKVSETLTVSGLAYYRRFKSRVVDGNVAELEKCEEVINDPDNAGADASGVTDPNNLCSGELENNQIQQVEDAFGNPIGPGQLGLADFNDATLGVIDHIRTDSESFGFALQGADKRKLFGHNNHFIIGASYDQGNVNYQTKSELGVIGNRFVVTGSGIVLAEPDDFAPRNVDVDTKYLGLYFLNAFDVTDRLTVTAGGRFNYAKIDLVDLTGEFDGITSQHSFQRFNPTVGATYELVPGITLYGGYSEANRAPTPAELACANPDNPCPIESFLTDDPPLEQVVSKTYELGLRGQMKSASGDQRLNWGLGLFQTTNEDDILFVASSTTGRGFFFNAGETLRRGLEASLKYSWGPLSAYASYSYVKATYETANEFSSPAHPLGDTCVFQDEDTCIQVRPGDNIPGIPNHRFKTGFDYFVTPKWKVGADLIATSGQYFFGDDANLLPKLGGYTRVDVSTSYDFNKNVQFYAYANNIFDRKYGLFGTLFDADEAPGEVVAPGFTFTDPRSIVPATPIAIYGGVKVTF